MHQNGSGTVYKMEGRVSNGGVGADGFTAACSVFLQKSMTFKTEIDKAFLFYFFKKADYKYPSVVNRVVMGLEYNIHRV